MSNLYETIENLCEANSINITKMCKEAGVSRGSLTDLKKGRSAELSTTTMSKLAEYFGVSTDYLLGIDTDNVKAYDEHGEPLFIDDEVREIVDSLRTRPEMKILFSASKKATKEDIMKNCKKIIEALRNGEND
ncbi:MAG: helix-turn-helix transcriptional regulator [Ruminococcus sp.]|nr:MAG: helix-turn-helix transcriptional regulator [Ruminococcus sp.]